MDPRFEVLKKTTTQAELTRLAAAVQIHAEMLDEESLSLPHIDHTLARSVARVLESLLSDSAMLDAEQRALVGTAARYFVLTADEASDLNPDGLSDDRSVVAEVCQLLGRQDLADQLANEIRP